MKFFYKLRIAQKLNLLNTSLLIIVFILLGFFLYHQRKKELLDYSHQRMSEQVKDLVNIFDLQIKENQKRVNLSILIAQQHVNQLGEIEIDKRKKNVQSVVNQITKKTNIDTIPLWYLNEKLINNNTKIVDDIQIKTQTTVTIFQKIDNGYLRIATNVLDAGGKRATGTYIPNSSPVVRNIENGRTYSGRAYVVNDWYLTTYVPIYIEGKIEGMLYVGMKEKNNKLLRSIFIKKRYLKSGYPFLIDKFGNLKIHPLIEGKNILETKFYNEILQKRLKSSNIRYKWPEDETGIWKYLFYQYYPLTESYICVSVVEEELFKPLYDFRNIMIIVIGFSILIIIVLQSFLIKKIIDKTKIIVLALKKMSKGIPVEIIKIKEKDEIGEMTSSLNELIEGLNNTTKFSQEIRMENYENNYEPLSDEDVLGISLMKTRDDLKQAKEEQEKRRQENELKNSFTVAHSKLNDILRQNSSNLQDFGFDILKYIIDFLNANQGGLFLFAEENEELNLLTSYAYNRKKFQDKKILVGEGLVGSCAIEKKIIYLEEIPKNYLEITSGFGEAPPACILIVPMIMENNFLGVLEIASFNKMETYQIEFVEKATQAITTTFMAAKTNQKTSHLLKLSKQQSEEMATKEEEMRQNLEELKATQEEAARREAEMEGVFLALNENFGVAQYSDKGKFISINERFEFLYETTNKEFIGRNYKDVSNYFRKNEDEYNAFWNDLKIGKLKTLEEHIILLSGKQFWLNTNFSPIYDSEGNLVKILSISVEITKRKLQEQEINQKASILKNRELELNKNLNKINSIQEKLEVENTGKKELITAIENSLCMMEYLPDGTVLRVNDNYLKNYAKLTREEIIGKNLFDIATEEERKEIKEIWKKLHKGENINITLHRLDKMQNHIWLNVTFSPMMDSNNKIKKVLALAKNITNLKKAEIDANIKVKNLQNRLNQKR